MLGRLRCRPVGWIVAVGTLGALSATLIAAAPGGAATPEKEYVSTFEMQCIIGPGSVNIKGSLQVETKATGPETTSHGEVASFHGANSTITSSPALSQPLYNGGTREVRGSVLHFAIDTTGAEPNQLNIAEPAEFPEGLPYKAPVENEKDTSFTAPSEGRTFSFGPYTVTAPAGGTVEATVGDEPAYEENAETGYRSTGEGVQSTLTGYTESGEKTIGPLPVSCNAPSGVVLAKIPVSGGSGGGTETTSSTSSSTSTTTTTTTRTSTQTSAGPVEINFHNWKLKGSMTNHKLNETIDLPEGCTFNGHGQIPGPVEGNTYCPPFTAHLKLLGAVPENVGLNIVQAEPIKGTISEGKTPGDLIFKSLAKDTIEITSIGSALETEAPNSALAPGGTYKAGASVPVACKTWEPVVFPMETEAPSTALSGGTTFTGETTVPEVTCRGLTGAIYGPLITEVFSGPNNPFTFTIEP